MGKARYRSTAKAQVSCHEPSGYHKPGCYVKRPLCCYRRRPYVCGCDAYHYPHRRGGGLCNDENRWRAQYGDDAVNEWLVTSQKRAQ